MRRVVSLLPSASETLAAIEGGAAMLVGRSHECNYPQSIATLPILTGQRTSEEWKSAKEVDTEVSSMLKNNDSLYTINEKLLEELKPDVILTQDICAVCAIDLPTVRRIAARMNPSPMVVSLDPAGLDGVIDDLRRVGEVVKLQKNAMSSVKKLTDRIENIKSVTSNILERPNVAFIEWPDPIYIGGHWTPQMIHLAGGSHPLNPSDGEQGAGKSFPVSAEDLSKSDPSIVIISPCGLKLPDALREAMLLEKQEWFRNLRAYRDNQVYVVDGDAMFNRPGPRLVDALEWLHAIMHAPGDPSENDFPYVKLRRGT